MKYFARLAASFAVAVALAFAFALPVWASPQAPGGSDQRPSVEGCMNQWLFDGVWRMRVLSVTPSGNEVVMEVRNGWKESLRTSDSGFAKINGQGIDLAFSDGTVSNLDIANTKFREELSTINLPPGGKATTTLLFVPPASAAAKPVKLLVAVDPAYNSYVHYSVKDPSFRVRLDCTK